jgi:putative transposase
MNETGRDYFSAVCEEYTGKRFAIHVDGSIRSSRVIEVLAKLVSGHGDPKCPRSHNDPEYLSGAPALGDGGKHRYRLPDKSLQRGSNESFNGEFRDECLGMRCVKNRIDAKIRIEELRREFNEVRPHSSLGWLTPVKFKQQLLVTDPNSAVSKGA